MPTGVMAPVRREWGTGVCNRRTQQELCHLKRFACGFAATGMSTTLSWSAQIDKDFLEFVRMNVRPILQPHIGGDMHARYKTS